MINLLSKCFCFLMDLVVNEVRITNTHGLVSFCYHRSCPLLAINVDAYVDTD